MGNTNSTTQTSNTTTFNYLQGCQDWVSPGFEQSPIDIIPKDSQFVQEMKMELLLTDHVLKDMIVQDTGNALTCFGPFSKLRATDVEGNSYEFEALQFHFHAPAEHTINGGQYELELHIVHQMTEESAKNAKTQRKLAVVAVFFQLDTSNQAVPHDFITALNLNNTGSKIDLNMYQLLGDDLVDMTSFYAYKGSLTTPPCSELVNWYLFETPLKITKSQLDQFNQRWKDNCNHGCGHGNNRPTQQLNGRNVLKSNNCCVMAKSEEAVKKVQAENRPHPNLQLTIHREIILDDFAMKSQFAKGNTQGFISTPTYKKQNSTIEGGESTTNHKSKKSSAFTPRFDTIENANENPTFTQCA
jgi:carbonic anhydrase